MIKKFNIFIENATSTLGNTGGMGNVVSANPSAIPGDVAGSSVGSGDIGSKNTYTVTNIKSKRKKSKKSKVKDFSNEQEKLYNDMYVTRFHEYEYTKKIK